MIEVEATHSVGGGRHEKLACELYPGVFVVDGGGVHAARVAGHLFTALPKGQDRTFPLPESTADMAVDLYDSLIEDARIDREYARTRGPVKPPNKFADEVPLDWEIPRT